MYENILESVRLDKAEDDWSPQTTKHSSDIIKNNEILRHIDHSYFLICNSCLWCATYFGIGNLESLCASQTHALSCHICNSCNTELMPISVDVSSGMEYSVTSGMEMEFYRTNNVIDRRQSANELHQIPVYF
jgi:hypothetical protein